MKRPSLLLFAVPMALGCSSPQARFDVPVPEAFGLSNGVPVWLVSSKAVPLVAVSVVVRAGSSADPRGREGLAALTANMLDEGAGGRGPLEIADEIEFLGAELSVRPEKEHIEITVESLRRNLDGALDVLADVVLRPDFSVEEFARVKGLVLGDLAQRREEPREVARVAAERAFYGEGHPYAHPVEGYEATVKPIALEEVKAFWRGRFRPGLTAILATGDIAPEELRERLEARFGSWTGDGGGAPAPAPGHLPPPASPRLVIVDKPGAPQTEVRVLLPAPAFGSPELAPLSLANTVLGGTFTSRLVSNLREKHGFTYGASSVIASRGGPCHLTAGSAVHAAKTGPALVELCREIRGMASGAFAPEELQKSRSTYRSRLVEALESIDSTLRLYIASAALGRPARERRDFHAHVQRTPDGAIAEAARKAYRWEDAVVILAGDRQSVEAQLEELRERPPQDVGGKPFALPQVEVRGRDGEKL
ncbi:MAG: insulinase family protein [Planctomycetes bacterium]|nr:insulinase family protein [Planctomycetota bacterium]